MYLDSGTGPGQPRKYRNPKRISAVIDEDNVSKLDEIRWRERKSFNEMLNKAIKEYVENHSDGNDTFKLDTWQHDSCFKIVPTLFSNNDKWQTYVSQCNNEELTQIGIKSGYVRGLVEMRRDREFRERKKE